MGMRGRGEVGLKVMYDWFDQKFGLIEPNQKPKTKTVRIW